MTLVRSSVQLNPEIPREGGSERAFMAIKQAAS